MIHVDLSKVAGFYSQLAGVLAGFAFVGIFGLLTAQFNGGTRVAVRSLDSVRPLLVAFMTLVLSSLNYAVVASELGGTARIAELHTMAGLGFSVAGTMLMHALLVLVRGLEADLVLLPRVAASIGRLLRVFLVFILPPLLVQLMWGGARDYLNHKYGPGTGWHAVDWGCFGVFCAVLINSAIVAIFFFRKGRQQYHRRLLISLDYLAIVLSIGSNIGTNILLVFHESSLQVPDYPLPAAVALVGLFTSVVAYSSARIHLVDGADAHVRNGAVTGPSPVANSGASARNSAPARRSPARNGRHAPTRRRSAALSPALRRRRAP